MKEMNPEQTARLKRLTALENIKTFDAYELTVLTHAFYPNKGANLAYPTLGLTGEAGEVANIVKKIQRDDKGVITPEKREKVQDELGDVLWYITACAEEIGLTLADIAAYNVRKLRDRHGVKNNGSVSNGADKFDYTPKEVSINDHDEFGHPRSLVDVPHSC